MPYALIGLVGSLALAVYYVVAADATRRSKCLIAIAECASLVMWLRYPTAEVFAILLQAVVSVYVLIFIRMNRDFTLRSSGTPSR